MKSSAPVTILDSSNIIESTLSVCPARPMGNSPISHQLGEEGTTAQTTGVKVRTSKCHPAPACPHVPHLHRGVYSRHTPRATRGRGQLGLNVEEEDWNVEGGGTS